MIEVDIAAMREEGLLRFRRSIETRVQSGIMPDSTFVQNGLLEAMGPILRALVGPDAKPEEHIRIHVRTEASPEGQLMTFTEAEGLSPMGEIAIESFMDLSTVASA